MNKKRHIKRCDPSICDHCQYIGEGDFVCDVDPAEHRFVMEDWSPTEHYLHCQSAEAAHD